MAALGSLMAAKPSLEAVQKFSRDAVTATEGLSEDVKKELETVISGLKGSDASVAENDAKAKLRENNIVVEDIYAFKAGLIPSKAAMPLEPLTVAAKL